jgi:hypothetical protein
MKIVLTPDQYEQQLQRMRELKAVKLNPDNPVVWHNFAHHLEDHLQKSVEAETAFRESIRFDPTHACPFAGLALILQPKNGNGSQRAWMPCRVAARVIKGMFVTGG